MTEQDEEKRRKEQLLLDNYYSFGYQTKTTIEIANEKVAGHLLTNLYKTIGLISDSELILEIDGKDKYRFTECYLAKLSDNEGFEAISEQQMNLKTGAVFKNKIIKEICQSQYGEWTLCLENNIIIESRSENGTDIFIGEIYW